jgi:hypothetical protein
VEQRKRGIRRQGVNTARHFPFDYAQLLFAEDSFYIRSKKSSEVLEQKLPALRFISGTVIPAKLHSRIHHSSYPTIEFARLLRKKSEQP